MFLLYFVVNSSSWTTNDATTRPTTTTWDERGQWKSWQSNESKHDASSTKSITAATNAIYACAKYESKQYAYIADFTYASDNEFTIVISFINVTTFITNFTFVDGWSTKSTNVGWTKKYANDEPTWCEPQSKHATISITAPSANTRNVPTGTFRLNFFIFHHFNCSNAIIYREIQLDHQATLTTP